MIIRTKSYPRVGLIGNPSDGYFGKTISFAFDNFCAECILYESPELEILPCHKDQSCFSSIEELVHDVDLHGYYGGIRLLKATIKRFHDYCGGIRSSCTTRISRSATAPPSRTAWGWQTPAPSSRRASGH